MKTISLTAISALKKLLERQGVSLHFTDGCGSQSADITYPAAMTEQERAEVRGGIQDFLEKEGVTVAFSKKGDSFWVRQER